MLLVMNCMYSIPMNVEQEVLNNPSQFNKQLKSKMQQGGHIEIFTMCKDIINQQEDFICKKI